MKSAFLWRLIETYEVDFETPSNGEIMHFRLELFEQEPHSTHRKFRTRAFRYDLFETRPLVSFRKGRTKKADAHHEWAIIDAMFDMFEIEAKTPTMALRKALKAYSQQLGLRLILRNSK
jgi:hypothetical protein